MARAVRSRSPSGSIARPAQPLAAQLAGQVRAAHPAGLLAGGSRLPSTRALAAELGVARGVVEQAFDQLVGGGLARGVARLGHVRVGRGRNRRPRRRTASPGPTPGPRAQRRHR